jgi:transcription elongation factor Elf1
MNAPLNRDASPSTARTYTPAMLARALAAGKARESVTSPQPDVEPAMDKVVPNGNNLVRLAVEDHKTIMNENQITTTCSCPSCGTRLRMKITNPDNGIGSATCSFCCRSFRYEVPFHVMADYWRKQRERRASRSNLQSII